MPTEFALDLRAARRKAGYLQGDIARLLAVHQSAVSDLEHGRRQPTLAQIVTLALIYGRSFESHFSEVMKDSRNDLKRRLRTLPRDARDCAATRNRAASIARLKRRLEAEHDHHEIA